MSRKSSDRRGSHPSSRQQRRDAARRARHHRQYAYVAGVVLVALAAIAAYLLFRDDGNDGFEPVVVRADITAPVDGRVAGQPDAPVSVVEWGDYQ